MDISKKAAEVAGNMGMVRLVRTPGVNIWRIDKGDHYENYELDKPIHQDALALRCLREMAVEANMDIYRLNGLLYADNEAIFGAYLDWEGKR